MRKFLLTPMVIIMPSFFKPSAQSSGQAYLPAFVSTSSSFRREFGLEPSSTSRAKLSLHPHGIFPLASVGVLLVDPCCTGAGHAKRTDVPIGATAELKIQKWTQEAES